MAIAGTHPEAGLRVALDLQAIDGTHARYHGAAFTPDARYELSLLVDLASGKARVEPSSDGLSSGDLAFVQALGAQLWRRAVGTPADQGGGSWARRVQRWRGPQDT